MATANQNLSDYDYESVPEATGMRFGVVVSEWNHAITSALAEGAIATLQRHGAAPDDILVHHVPGSYELPFGAQLVLESSNVDAVICLGSVIRGETSHFDFVCQAVSQGIKDVGLAYHLPVVFGVLTDDNLQQAKDRSGGRHGNKGDEAAVTAIKMVALQNNLEQRVFRSSL
ncbi:MAG: 6,7-dimethyl-8-ribityllumazine synthase [Salibacteraceae bacterium]